MVQALIESKDALPVVLHADDGPAVLVRLIVERLGKGASASNAKEKAALTAFKLGLRGGNTPEHLRS